ncbi:UDP-N-acetylglucosamine 2-epimerase [Sulfurimonas sp.]|uniref:UDP-N-acetylglucosamine 2-epimerase n=1 Tax=Sulfurimonas sp. TaxID=2022749 RepID=UPI00356266A5
MDKKKVLIVTGGRAEYGLLYPVIKKVSKHKDLDLQLLVTGMHLKDEFGSTYKEIEKEFVIDKKVDIPLDDDSAVGISESISCAVSGFAKSFSELKPDILVVLGDRYEIFAAVTAAMVANIPIAHIHGGEITEGAIDDAIRHSITKMSHLHFTSTNEYKNRVIQLGEDPKRVFNVGALGVENIKNIKVLSREEFEKSIDFKLTNKNILVTFHPVTLDKTSSKEQFNELLKALDDLKDTNIIFTKANSDTDGKIINSMIDEYVSKNPQKSVAFASLGMLRYFSALTYVDAVVGNSSSGIIEVPSFKKATINIGDRQKGRLQAGSVINSSCDYADIKVAIDKGLSNEFNDSLVSIHNPYEGMNTSDNIIKEIVEVDLSNILKKKFWDISYE